MSDDREFWAATTDWLEAGSDRTPPPAIDAVLLAIRTTRQERVLWGPWRTRNMALFARVAVAAAAVLALAVAWVNLSPRTTGPGATPSPTATPTPSLITDTADHELDAGTYQFTGAHSGVPAELRENYPQMIFTVPSGWMAESATVLTKNYEGTGGVPPFLFVWGMDRGFVDPCTDHTPVMPPAGSGAAGLLDVIAGQPGIDAGPVTDVTLGGYTGAYVDYTVTTDPATCGNGQDDFWIWGSSDGDSRWGVSLNDPERLYALNVDGTVYTFFTGQSADITATDRAELQAIIDSIDFAP